MQIRSTRQSLQRPLVAPRTSEPAGVTLAEVAPTIGGVVLGGVSAVLGHELAKNYGNNIADTLIRKGMPLVTEGFISLDCALKALPYITDRATQLRVGALSFGLAGFAAGAALLWPREG